MQHPHYRISGDLPLLIEAGDHRSVAELCAWLAAEAPALRGEQRRHGAFLFRGFDVRKAEDFEAVARTLAPGLEKDYLGTSPRDAVTEFVFNASELPDFFPIPQHCEMSFCATPPSHLFFCALTAPAAGSGETPLCDFRRVWQTLDPDVRERFETRGLRHVRNYAPPGESGGASQLKPWQDMFGTTDHAAVEARCRTEGFEPEWLPGDGLRLWSDQPVFRDHPETGERAWHNHLTTFHSSTPVDEYERIHAYRPTERHQQILEMARGLEAETAAMPAAERSMHTLHADGSEIAREDVQHVRDVIWQETVVTPWEDGDIIAIDNHSIAHGRLPYEGPRHIVVCWGQDDREHSS